MQLKSKNFQSYLDEIPATGLEGRIALAKRGVIRFQVKAENVFVAGAVVIAFKSAH